MNLRSRHFLVLTSLVLLLCVGGVGVAVASPDGDDDSTYNASGPTGFGTQYSLIAANGSNTEDVGARPVTDQDPTDGSSVTAVVLHSSDGKVATDTLRLTRFDASGQPSGFAGGQGAREDDIGDIYVEDLLDLRVLSSGEIVVLARVRDDDDTSAYANTHILVLHYSVTGDPISKANYYLDACYVNHDAQRAIVLTQYFVTVDAARVRSDGTVSALWDCIHESQATLGTRDRRKLTRGGDGSSVYITQYGNEGDELTDQPVQGDFGKDLELGPGSSEDPYALVGTYGDAEAAGTRQTTEGDSSTVYHATPGSSALVDPSAGGTVPGLPVDLAVDSQGRPVVQTGPENEQDDVRSATRAAGDNEWDIYRLTPALATDGSWGTGGLATISDPRLGQAYGGDTYDDPKTSFLTARPGDKILATGAATEHAQIGSTREHLPFHDAVIAGLTSTGQTDTGFADSGFKVFTTTGSAGGNDYFNRVSEPTLQSDGKVLVPSTTFVGEFEARAGSSDRIAPAPSDLGAYVGVTRLGLGSSSGSSTPASSSQSGRPLAPSSVPKQCGRRTISLVRADVRGRKVRLTGLVGASLYGKKVSIEADPTAVKVSGYSRTATVTASKTTGAFAVTVAAPARKYFKSVRYRAESGRATSAALKLPQSLSSRSVRSAKGTITVKGQVNRSVLGKRNPVKIRRLVCGHYRTVATVKPDASGRYTATFKATTLRGVAFYRAESSVQVRPGSKKYAIQYARAISIRTTSQTG